MEQTAVEWLMEQITYNNAYGQRRNSFDDDVDLSKYFNQAKEMEKKQIIDAREDGFISTYAEYGETPRCYLDGSSEQYYNETFKNK